MRKPQQEPSLAIVKFRDVPNCSVYQQVPDDEPELQPGAGSGCPLRPRRGRLQPLRQPPGLATPPAPLGRHLDNLPLGLLHHGRHHQVSRLTLLHTVRL